MRVLSVPPRLRLAAGFLALSAPLAAVQAVLTVQAAWWKLPYRAIAFSAAGAFAVSLLLMIALLRGRKWALRVTDVVGGLWCLFTIGSAVAYGNSSLGFFTVILMAYWVMLHLWLHHEMGRSFFDPKLRWYQRSPKPIPGLHCELKLPGSAGAWRMSVSRLDEDGMFVFADEPFPAPAAAWVSARKGRPPAPLAELTLTHRERQVSCVARPVRTLVPRGVGVGFRFEKMSPDARKELGDFVELLRGEGYVG